MLYSSSVRKSWWADRLWR